MSTLVLILVIAGGFLAALTIGGAIAYRKFAVPVYKPLSPGDRAICAEIVKRHQGYPWLCAHCVKVGACPCQPCQKVANARLAQN